MCQVTVKNTLQGNFKPVTPRRTPKKSPRKRGPSSPTVLDFIQATGTPTKAVDNKELMNYMNYDMLHLSSVWAKLVMNEKDLQGRTPATSLEMFAASLCRECAIIEVEAVAMLASPKKLSNLDDKAPDDDDMSKEWSQLSSSSDTLRAELQLAEEVDFDYDYDSDGNEIEQEEGKEEESISEKGETASDGKNYRNHQGDIPKSVDIKYDGWWAPGIMNSDKLVRRLSSVVRWKSDSS
mmetsp:Transcript_8107/g.12538  ORF Transcript_8107/g.12538 Transcript_8107/m.12538 type:complete len:237 (-) Transcript_8107:113-823(-)